ncbi:conserved hypothetical protein [Trichinella spiralis]|uniref:hypothetical protein n=1 Tax=Trichinella spiralis TaxID=6334 RepID=UPI0001EFE129|nr:conserved hypothetical protein [Trichinella spiralis]
MDGNLILNSKITEENKSPEESMDIQEAPFSHTFLLENQKTAMEKLSALMTKVEVYKNFIVEKQKHCYKRAKTSTTVLTDRIADIENASPENALFKGTLHGYQEEGVMWLKAKRIIQ